MNPGPSNLPESKESGAGLGDLPPLHSVVCVRNRESSRSLSLETCHIGRVEEYTYIEDIQHCVLHLFLRPDLLPQEVDTGDFTLNKFREVIYDHRKCLGSFDVDDIITECEIIQQDNSVQVKSSPSKHSTDTSSSKPHFVLRFQLKETKSGALVIKPFRLSKKLGMARHRAEVLSENSSNIEEKNILGIMKSPRSAKKRIIEDHADDLKENVAIEASPFRTPSNSKPSSSVTSQGRSRVRRSLVSDLDGPPVKLSRNENEAALCKTEDTDSASTASWVSELLDVNDQVVENGARCVTPIRLSLKRVWLDATPSKDTQKISPLKGSRPQGVRRSARKTRCTIYMAESTDDSDVEGARRSAQKSQPSTYMPECTDDSDFEGSLKTKSHSKKQGRKSEAEKGRTNNRTPRRKTVQESSETQSDDEIFISTSKPSRPRRTLARTPTHREQDVDNCMSPDESRIALAKRTPSKNFNTTSDKTPKKTPKAASKTPTKSPKTPKAKTPSRTTRGCFTPSMPVRASAPLTPMSSLEQVRKNLHVSAVPLSLPCREAEYRNIYNFLENKIRDSSGGCMYISGVPGTGKTATVNAVVRSLKVQVEQKKLRDFQYIEVNGLKMTEPRQVFVQVLKSLTGQKCTPQQAQDILAQRFCSGSAKNKTVVLLVDEVDMLRNRRQDVIYNLFDWPSKPNSHFIVLTIANTMDLPERLLKGRVTSRLGLTRLTFQPYSYKQLQEIVLSRIQGSNSFNDDAVELVARKVAACSGDVRRALDICRRASEVVQEGSAVTMPIINKVLSQMMNSANVCSIKACSKLEKLFLQAVVAENERTGVEETTFISVYRQLQSLCALASVSLINISEAMAVLNRLGTSGLLLIEHSRADINQSIFLNVNVDDVHYALSQALPSS